LCEGEKFDCKQCTQRDKDIRDANGKRRWTVGEETVFGCPQKLITEGVGWMVELWGKYKRFGLPYAGGWAEQPARVFDVIDALDRTMNEIEHGRLEKARGNK
jgi:hypothetical protein